MSRRLLALVLLVCSGCRDGESLAPVRPCAPTGPSSHWPAESGILQLDVPPPTGPVTPSAHRDPPPIVLAHPTVVTEPRVVTVMVAGDPLQGPLEAFTDAVGGSAWFPAVSAEYGVTGMRPAVHVTGPPMPAAMAGPDMTAYVGATVAGTDGAPDGATVYVVFLAPGTLVVDSNNQLNCGCSELSGVHYAYDTAGDTIAIIQRCSTSDVDGLTSTTSHEILEAVTNPSNNDGFVEPVVVPPWDGTMWFSNELADLCAGTRIHEGEWEYQRSFSNRAAAQGGDPCVPPLTEPYFNVSAAQDWYAVPASGTVEVTLTGWSTGLRDDWLVYVAPTRDTRFAATLTSGESASDDGFTFYGINNGKTATLTMTAVSAVSGESTLLQLYSRASSPGNDVLHLWRVGFYVP